MHRKCLNEVHRGMVTAILSCVITWRILLSMWQALSKLSEYLYSILVLWCAHWMDAVAMYALWCCAQIVWITSMILACFTVGAQGCNMYTAPQLPICNPSPTSTGSTSADNGIAVPKNQYAIMYTLGSIPCPSAQAGTDARLFHLLLSVSPHNLIL